MFAALESLAQQGHRYEYLSICYLFRFFRSFVVSAVDLR